MTQEEFNVMFVTAVSQYYGKAMENDGPSGDIPLVNSVDPANVRVPLMQTENNTPTGYIQTTLSVLAQIAANMVLNGLVIDQEPTHASDNAVSSGGTYQAIHDETVDKLDKITQDDFDEIFT